jgi:hypothetical protein
MLLLSGSIFVTIRHFNSFIPIEILIQTFFAASFSERIISSLTDAAAAHDEAAVFKNSWAKAMLPTINSHGQGGHINVLKISRFLPQIQFRIGIFYGVTSYSVLKFFSIVTTYIILLLQIY